MAAEDPPHALASTACEGAKRGTGTGNGRGVATMIGVAVGHAPPRRAPTPDCLAMGGVSQFKMMPWRHSHPLLSPFFLLLLLGGGSPTACTRPARPPYVPSTPL